MSLLAVRWVFLAGAVVLCGRFLAFSRTLEALGAFLACGLVWAFLSQLKARSMDGPSGGRPW
ncbi:MAG: hypothetical protein HZB91_13905 [Elusimicrobia bacterium]|nr:hypothetical protein [Elusimicrobiota bacterium]